MAHDREVMLRSNSLPTARVELETMMYWYEHRLELRIVKLGINLVTFRERNVMVIQVGTCDVGKLHEAVNDSS
jgi:hypothetical protein